MAMSNTGKTQSMLSLSSGHRGDENQLEPRLKAFEVRDKESNRSSTNIHITCEIFFQPVDLNWFQKQAKGRAPTGSWDKPMSECQKGRVVKTTYQHFPLNGRPCQNARWVVLTLCENSPFVSECIVALYRNGTLSALDGYIVTLEFAHPVQHYHFDPERSTLDTYIRSQLNCGILTPNGTFTTRRCAHTERGTFSP